MQLKLRFLFWSLSSSSSLFRRLLNNSFRFFVAKTLFFWLCSFFEIETLNFLNTSRFTNLMRIFSILETFKSLRLFLMQISWLLIYISFHSWYKSSSSFKKTHVIVNLSIKRSSSISLLRTLIISSLYFWIDLWLNSEHLNIRRYIWENVLMKILLYSFSSILYCCFAFLPVIRSIKLRVKMFNIKSNNLSNCFCFSD